MGYGIKLESANVGAKPFYDSDTDVGEIKQVLDSFTMTAEEVVVKTYPAEIDVANVFIHQTSTATLVRDVVQYDIAGQTITFRATGTTPGLAIPVVVLL